MMTHYFWVFAEKFGGVILRVLSIMLLSRLLSPEEFGLFAMVAVIVSIGVTLVDSGMGGALIRQTEVRDIDYSTVFVCNLFFSALLFFLIYFCAPLLADFYSSPEVENLAKALSFILVIKAFSIIQITKLTKELRFKEQAVIYLGSFAFSMVVAVALAYRGWGYWSLVAQQWVEAVLTTFLFLIFSRYFPGVKFSKESFRELFLFGSMLTLASLLKAVYQNSVIVIFGKRFSASVVGLYGQANKVNEIYANTISAVVEKASFPIFVKRLNDQDLYIAEVIRTLEVVVFVCFPGVALLSVCSEPIVMLILGYAWIESAWMLEIIAFAGMGMMVESVTRSALKALGRAGLILKLELLKRSLSILLLLALSTLGVKAVLFGVVASAILSALVNVGVIVRILEGVSLKSFSTILLAMLAVIISYSFAFYVKENVHFSHPANFFILTSVLCITYLCLCAFFKVKAMSNIFQELNKCWGSIFS